ncbi:adenylate kinase [Portibacter lacus]|uniref:Adenylate kinase n=2 Tax=Portibacter lacus TaxID=1099794 RepID=A0AA37STU5_9BACT|nr:adenylate kinase [Portibacter lacus]
MITFFKWLRNYFFPNLADSDTNTEYMINLILFGPPGSGKGTQAKKLVEKYNLLHISTGDLFRYEIGNKTELGLKAQAFMEKGELVPDEVTIGMLNNKVEANPDVEGYIFDGFPRTIPQAESLDKLLKSKGQQVAALIALNVDDDEIVKRLLERGKTSGRADDISEEVIRKRIRVYNETTAVVYNYYDQFGKSQSIEGKGSIEDIFGRISDRIEKLNV